MAVVELKTPPGTGDLTSALDLIALVNGGSMVQAVRVAAELGIADLIARGVTTADELAHATQTHASSLHRLLRALATLALCVENEDGTFTLTRTGSLLRADTAESLRSWVIWCSAYLSPVWGRLDHSVKTGESARSKLTGTDGFAHQDRDDGAAGVFNRAMAEVTRLVAREVVRAYDFIGVRRIVDVGGGYGAMIVPILQSYPEMRGMLLDRPHAADGARTCLANAGLCGRCEFVTGDFFKAVPAGADAYLLKAILHDWDDARSALILGNCRRAIAPTGRLLVVERVLPSRFKASPLHHALARADLSMLVSLGGQERTEAEFSALLALAGFRLVRVIPTELEYSVLECAPC